MRLSFALGCLLITGCHLLYPFSTSERSPADADDDVATADAGTAEASVAADGSHASRDAPGDAPSDLTHDTIPVFDLPQPDTPPADGPAVDQAAADAPATGAACNALSAKPTWSSGNGLVICRELNYKATNLCQASSLCNLAGGWKLCPASIYRSKLAASGASPQANAWLASCVRSNGTAQAPSDTPCKCVEKLTPSTPITWLCTSGTKDSNTISNNVGLKTAQGCRRVGINGPATEGLWTAHEPVHSLVMAVCCQ